MVLVLTKRALVGLQLGFYWVGSLLVEQAVNTPLTPPAAASPVDSSRSPLHEPSAVWMAQYS